MKNSCGLSPYILSLIFTLMVVPQNAFAFSRGVPTAAQAAAAKAKADAAKPMSCLERLRGLSNSTGAVYDQIKAMKATSDISVDEYASNYGNICAIRKFSEDAEARHDSEPYFCYKAVKDLIRDKAPWMTSQRLPGGSAYMAKDALDAEGYIDILPSHPELYDDPNSAPPGAMIIYTAKPGVICRFTWLFCKNVKHGDIQVRTPNGYFAGYFSPNAMSKQYRGSETMEVAAVMLKPMKIKSFNREKNCFESDPITVPSAESTWPSRASNEAPGDKFSVSHSRTPANSLDESRRISRNGIPQIF